MQLSRLKRALKVRYYKTLCLIFSPVYTGGSNQLKVFQRWIAIFAPNRTIAWIKISGKVLEVGYKSWMLRTAKHNSLECFASTSKTGLDVILVGKQSAIENVIKAAWKGPPRARVTKLIERYFNYSLLLPNTDKIDLIWSPKIVERLIQNTNLLGEIMEVPNSYTQNENVSSAGELKRAALNRNLFVFRHRGLNYVCSPSRQIGLHGSLSSRVSTTVRSITDNKDLTKRILFANGVPVPKGKVFTELSAAIEYFSQCDFPLVVKPIAGSFGTGVTIDVRTVEELKTAWDYARLRHDQVVLEEMVDGIDVRVMVIGGTAKAALLRVPANVIGDGQNTIAQLIDAKNQQRLSNPRLSKAPIITNAHVRRVLDKQGFTMKSVPNKGKMVFLNLKANIEAGGDSINITEHIHPGILEVAEQAAACFGVNDFWGIDILLERLDSPPEKQRCVIIEMNSRANIYNVHYPLYGPPFDAAKALVEHLFPENITDASYPKQSLKIKVTGILEAEFLDWVCMQAKKYELRGHISSNGRGTVVAGRQRGILFFLDKIWGWKGKVGLVDGFRVTGADEEITDSNFFVDHTETTDDDGNKGIIHFCHGLEIPDIIEHEDVSNEDIDLGIFFRELQKKGFTARHLYEEVFELEKGSQVGIMGMHHSSIFCDKLCDQILPMKKLLSFYGIPTPRGVRFPVNQMARGLDYFKSLDGVCIVTALQDGYKEVEEVSSAQQLSDFWKSARDKGVPYLLIEENISGAHICVAVVSGQPEAALLLEPVSIVGNGSRTVEQLIAKKNELRQRNPRYRCKTVKYEDTSLSRQSIGKKDILKRGKKVFMESPVKLELGGETANISAVLHEDFSKFAAQAVNAIPGLKLAYVYLTVPNPQYPAEKQYWGISRIDTRPSVAKFHFPWRGEAVNLTEVIIDKLYS